MAALAMVGAGSPPGHCLPPGVDVSTQASVTAWVASFRDGDMVDAGYADMLIAAGYKNLYVMDFTVEDMHEMTDGNGVHPPLPTCRRMFHAATAVLAQLGVPRAATPQPPVGDGVPIGVGVATHPVAPSDRGECPALPVVPAAQLTGLTLVEARQV